MAPQPKGQRCVWYRERYRWNCGQGSDGAVSTTRGAYNTVAKGVTVLVIDDVSAKEQWRFCTCPEQARKKGALAQSPLQACPANRVQLLDELQRLPPVPDEWHFMVPCASRRICKLRYGYTVCAGRFPPHSFVRTARGAAILAPELCFMQLANRLSLPQLVLLGDEWCGTYTLACDEEGRLLRRDGQLCTLDSLRYFAREASWMGGSKRARTALGYIVEGAASVRESMLEMMLCLPQRLGGFGLPRPQMNYEVAFDTEARLIAGHECAYCDLCWPEARVDVEYDGQEWHEGINAVRDKERANALRHMGYTVLFVSKEDFERPWRLKLLAHQVARAIGWRQREYLDDVDERRQGLLAELLDANDHPVLGPDVLLSSQHTLWNHLP